MKRITGIVALLCIFCFAGPAVAENNNMENELIIVALGEGTIEGTLMKIDGDFYVIMDGTGKEQRVHVDKSTIFVGKVQPGAKVKAQVTPEGHASALEKVRPTR